MLKYSAAVNVIGQTGQIDYSNSATVELLGKSYQTTSGERHLTDYTSTAVNFRVEILKQDGANGRALPGAVFALYAENGSLIFTGETNSNGRLVLQTSIIDGIRFQKDTPYYILEIQAPDGYVKDTEKHWFYFGDESNAELETRFSGISRFPQVEQMYTGSMTVKNTLGEYVLPATGGTGTFLYTAGGIALVCTALMIGHRKRKRERA